MYLSRSTSRCRPATTAPPTWSSSYPVLYLFRGHEHEWVHRWQDRSRHGRTVIDVYRRLLHEGKVGPLILVFPGISSDDNRIPGLLVNFSAPQLVSKIPGIGTGRFEDYFFKELIPTVDRMFRTIRTAADAQSTVSRSAASSQSRQRPSGPTSSVQRARSMVRSCTLPKGARHQSP